MTRRGRPVSEGGPHDARLRLRYPAAWEDRLDIAAAAWGCTRPEAVRRCIDRGLETLGL